VAYLKVIFGYSPGVNEENHENSIMIVGESCEIQTGHLPNTSQEYLSMSQFARSLYLNITP